MKLVKVMQICDDENPLHPYLYGMWINRDNISRVEGNGTYENASVIYFMTPLRGIEELDDKAFEIEVAGDPETLVPYLNGDDHTNTPTWVEEST